MSQSSTALAAACVSVGLVTAWSPCAKGDVMAQVNFNAMLNASVSHAIMLFTGLGSGSGGLSTFAITGATIPASGVGICCLTLLPYNSISDVGSSFAMIGIGLGSGNSGGAEHLVITTCHGSGGFGQAFETLFPGYNELQLMDQLRTGSPAAEQFVRTKFADLMGMQGVSTQAIGFSNATDFGTISLSLSAVPSPSAMGLLTLGIIGACRRRRIG